MRKLTFLSFLQAMVKVFGEERRQLMRRDVAQSQRRKMEVGAFVGPRRRLFRLRVGRVSLPAATVSTRPTRQTPASPTNTRADKDYLKRCSKTFESNLFFYNYFKSVFI